MDRNYDDWAADTQQLYELAQELCPQSPLIELRVSRQLADKAVAAWHREDEPGELPHETSHQRSTRDGAATLALIGAAIEETGVEDGDQVVFKLDAWVLGNTLEAADRAGRLDVFGGPSK